jgi:hypothetical protein
MTDVDQRFCAICALIEGTETKPTAAVCTAILIGVQIANGADCIACDRCEAGLIAAREVMNSAVDRENANPRSPS